MMKSMLKVLTLGTLLVSATNVWSQWALDSDESSINFQSTKNGGITETHGFSSVSGYISIDGEVQLNIELASVETSIPIRNQRMRELLFKTTQFPTATASASIDSKTLAATAAEGIIVTTEVSMTLQLHGLAQELLVPVRVFRDGVNLRVLTPSPVIVDATDFNLGDGVEALRAIAGLASISTDIPVTVNLLFSRELGEESL